MTYERSRDDRYAPSALRNKRASLASEIVQLERKLRHCRESLVHVDATLKMLDPDREPESIPNKRPVKRVKLFRQGDLGLDVMRNATSPSAHMRWWRTSSRLAAMMTGPGRP